MNIRVVPCAVCGRPKLRETDPERVPGHCTRMRLSGWCACDTTYGSTR